MLASRLQSYGDVDQFKLEEVPQPVPAAGEVLIKVEASGLNPVDLYVRQGFLADRLPITLPAILGVDAAGTIVAAGANVPGFAIGDRVIGHLPINGKGAHAEFAIVPLEGLAHLADTVSFPAGATLPLAGLTGRQVVDALSVKPGDRVLVTGALGAVGRASVQYLKELGAVPVAGVRSDRVAEAEAFAGEAIDLDAPASTERFRLVADTAGHAAAAAAIALMADGGTIVTCVQIPDGANAGDRVKVASIWTYDDPAMLQAVADAAARGELSIPIAATFPLADLAAAHRRLAAGHVGGKIIIAG